MAFRSSALDRRYIFEYDVGLWTYGTVQVLREKQTEELKLCKSVQKSLLRSPAEVMARLQRLRGLQHDNLSPVTDVLEDSHKIYVIADKCAGGDLAEWIARVAEEGNWFQEMIIAEYIRQTLIALVHLHGNRQCHRDLQPISIALTSKLPDAKVKVCDCGLAELFDPADELKRELNPYSAPEATTGHGQPGRTPPGPAADMWSVGAIAHQLLVGSTPSRSPEGATLLSALARAGSQALGGGREGDQWADRSALARDFVQRLLRVDPAARPTAAVALQHPWMQACVPLEPSKWHKASESLNELRQRLLCYLLSVLLLPEALPMRDLAQMRSAFAAADSDRDGFLARASAQRLLKEHLPHMMPIDHALLIDMVDVPSAGAVNFCMFLAAYSIGHSFGAPEGTGKSQKIQLVVKKLLQAFFRTFGDGQRQVASISSVMTKLTSPAAREVEQCASIQYEDLVCALGEEGSFDAKALHTALLESGARGTPLAMLDLDDVEGDGPEALWSEAFGLDGLQVLMQGVFQTCAMNNGGGKQLQYKSVRSNSRLGGR